MRGQAVERLFGSRVRERLVAAESQLIVIPAVHPAVPLRRERRPSMLQGIGS